MQSLKQAVTLARSGKSVALVRAAHALEGCPVGGWGETAEARRDIVEYLPARHARSYTLDDFISTVYTVDHADRYRSTM